MEVTASNRKYFTQEKRIEIQNRMAVLDGYMADAKSQLRGYRSEMGNAVELRFEVL